jgi:hypothetical protein
MRTGRLSRLEKRLQKLESRTDFVDPWPAYYLEVDRVARKSLSPEDRKLLMTALSVRKNNENISEVQRAVLQRWDAAVYAAEEAVPRPYNLDRDDMRL